MKAKRKSRKRGRRRKTSTRRKKKKVARRRKKTYGERASSPLHTFDKARLIGKQPYSTNIEHNKRVWVSRTLGTVGYDPREGHMTYSIETGGLVKTPFDRTLDEQTEAAARREAAKHR